VKTGDALPPQRTLVRAEAMPIWAAALHDPNPIHVDPAAVRALGLGDRVINQGPINVGYLVNMLAAAFPGSRLERVEVRFQANVFAGDVAVASGTIAAVNQADHRVDCNLLLTVEGGQNALVGAATVRLAG
jgi:3-hydroxybutyryl-CoA dehydratase